MKFTEAVKKGLNNIPNFNGRARRSEYWWYVLAIDIAIFVIGGILGTALNGQAADSALRILSGVTTVAFLSCEVRRLHDIGKSGWWLLIGLVPIVGAILLIVWAAKDSQPGDNQYGPNPKEVVKVEE